MANAFDAMAARMDAVTASRFGKEITINGTVCIAVESHFIPELGPMVGDGLNVVIFSAGYRPHKNDRVDYLGESYMVTRHQMFNLKPHIWLE